MVTAGSGASGQLSIPPPSAGSTRLVMPWKPAGRVASMPWRVATDSGSSWTTMLTRCRPS